MIKHILVLVGILFCSTLVMPGAEVLMVADEIPAMEVLARQLKQAEQVDSRIVTVSNMPASLAPFKAVFVYIHLAMAESAEKAFIHYATNGGRLIVLHHSISSGKRKNKYWFDFLGVALPEKPVDQGGYKWIEGVSFDVLNLAPEHFVTTHGVKYEGPVEFSESSSSSVRRLDGFRLSHSEVYLNHQLTGPRTLLLGFKYRDAPSGVLYQQATAGWCKPAGQGWMFYFLPGHSAVEFDHPAYARILANAVVWQAPVSRKN